MKPGLQCQRSILFFLSVKPVIIHDLLISYE